MAQNMPVVQSQGGPADIAQLLASLNSIFGSGTTKGSSETKSDATALGQSDELLARILQSVNPDALAAIEGNVLERARQSFAPARIAPNAAGIRSYTDSTKRSLENEAIARASAEAAAARQDAINAAHRNAVGLVEARVRSNTSSTQQQRTSASPTGRAAGLLLPAAMIYNRFNRGARGAGRAAPVESFYQEGELADTDFVPEPILETQEFSETGLLLEPSQSNIPTALSFGEEAGVIGDEIFGEAGADLLDNYSGGDFGYLEGAGEAAGFAEAVSGFEEVESLDFLDEIDFGGIGDFFDFGFADGGRVPGRRPAATAAYTRNALATRSRPAPARQSLARIAPASTKGGASRKGRTDTQDGEIISESGDESSSVATPTTGASVSDVIGNLGIGPVSLGFAGMQALMGNPFGAIAQLGKVAAINQTIDLLSTLGQTPEATMPAALAPDQATMMETGTLMPPAVIDPAIETIGAAVNEFGEVAAMPPAISDTGGGDVADAGGMPAADAGFATAGFGDEGGFGLDGGNSGDSGEDGGLGFNRGGKIKARNPKEASGIDKKIIKVTPGEMVIPVDTVELLGEDFFQNLIDATHTPVRRGR